MFQTLIKAFGGFLRGRGTCQCPLGPPVHKESQVTWGQSVQSPMLRAWKLGLTTLHNVPNPKSQLWHMDAYIATLFGGEGWDLCWELGCCHCCGNPHLGRTVVFLCRRCATALRCRCHLRSTRASWHWPAVPRQWSKVERSCFICIRSWSCK
jgi:hypothetical protein